VVFGEQVDDKMTKEEIENHFHQSCLLRDSFWETVGVADPDVIGHLINPAFMGGPRWPSLRQAFITVRRPGTTIIASDGLSDPFDDPDSSKDADSFNGFGLEFYVESPDNIVDVQGSWQFDMVYQISQNAAAAGNLQSLLKAHAYLTMELYDVRVPETFKAEEGRTGIFIGLTSNDVPDQVTLSLETVDIVNVKLLTLAELEYVAETGKEGRANLAQLFRKQGEPTYSDLKRKSVV